MLNGINQVRRWMEDGGVPITRDVIQGALLSLTYVATKVSDDACAEISGAFKAFAALGEEIEDGSLAT